MADGMDEDLLNYETDYSDYDLDNEKEDALLKEEDESEVMMEKCEDVDQHSSPCASEEEKLDFEEQEEEDILNLNYDEDEDFKVVEDKQYEEDDLKPNRSEKFASERQQPSQTSQKPTTIIEKSRPQPQKCKEFQNNYNYPSSHNNRRRGHFHQRGRNRERRNGTVFINQNYQGVVQLTNNTTRLACYSKPQNNSHYIDPWSNNVRPQRHNQIVSQVPSLLDLQTMERPNTFSSTYNHQPPARNFYQAPPSQPTYHNQNYTQWNGHPYNTYNYCQPEPPKVQVQVQPAVAVYPPLTSVPPPGFQGRPSFEPQFNSTQILPPPPPFPEFDNNYENYGYDNYSADTNQYQQENRYDNSRPSNSFNKQYDNHDHDNFNNRNSFSNKIQIHSIKKFHSEPTGNRSNYQENQNYNNPNYYNNKPVEQKPFQQNANNNKFTRKLVQTTRQPVISQVQKSSEPFEKKPKLETVEQIKPEPQNIEDGEDEETRNYRLKIEEQKRKREQILQLKEQRRRQNLQKQQEEATQEKLPPPRPPLNNIQVKKPAAPVRFSKQTVSPINIKEELSIDVPIIKKVIHNNIKEIIPESVNSGPSSSQPALNGFMSNRVVLVKNKNNTVLNNNSDGIIKSDVKSESSVVQNQNSPQSSSFMHNRKILTKDKRLLHTKLITISNLSKNTTTSKLVELTRGIGEIQNLQMDAQKRHATILFKAVASAHAFFTKYQRYMLDLSIIEVKLEPLL